MTAAGVRQQMHLAEDAIDWARIQRDLAAPFPPDAVEWRPQGKTAPGARVQLVAYIDARAVQDRLDSVVGARAWSFELEPLVVDGGELRVARGRLSIHGVSKDDVGTASTFEASKGTASDALKRAAVQWGIGRDLYALPSVWCTLDEQGHVPEAFLAQVRAPCYSHQIGGATVSEPVSFDIAREVTPAAPAVPFTLRDVVLTCEAFNVVLVPTCDRELARLWRQHHPQQGVLQHPQPGGAILAIAWREQVGGRLCVAFDSWELMYRDDEDAAGECPGARTRAILTLVELTFILLGARHDVPRGVQLQVVAIERRSDELIRGRVRRGPPRVAIIEQAPLSTFWPGADEHGERTILWRALWAALGTSATRLREGRRHGSARPRIRSTRRAQRPPSG